MFVIRAEYAEQAIDISDTVLRHGQCDVLVVDTLAHLIPSVEIEESSEKWQVGVQAHGKVGDGRRQTGDGGATANRRRR